MTGPRTAYLASAVPFALSFACATIGVVAFLNLAGVIPAMVAGLAFAGTLAVGFRLTGAGVPGPLWASVIVIAAVLAASAATVRADARVPLLVLVVAAAALALQTAGAHRITQALHELSVRRDGPLWIRVGSIPALAAGAATGIAVVAAAPGGAPLISATSAIAAVVLVRRVDLHR